MNYIYITLIAALLASFYPVIAKFGLGKIPPISFLAISQTVMALIFLSIAAFSKDSIIQYISLERHSIAAYGNGALMATSLFLFYNALRVGPVSQIVPIWSFYIVGVAVVGMLFLGEPLTTNRIIGLGFAIIAFYFITRGA